MCHVERMIGSLHSNLYRAIHLPLLPMLLYVQSMSPRWLSLSSCFYLVDNSARANITQLYKYHASPYTRILLNVKGPMGLVENIAPFRFIVDQYTIQFTLSDILQKHGLAQCHCGNMSILFLTLSSSFSCSSSYPLTVRSFC